MISLENVSYAYREGCPVLQKLSFSISKGEFVAIIGKNGSGKTTLARLLNGLLLPTLGRVVVDGLDTRNPDTMLEIRQKVGLLFAYPDRQLISNLVYEDVAFGPENLGLAPGVIKTRVETALRMVSMEDYAQYPPYLLSGGQKQRVCLAGLLAMRPACLVLDEPTAMLDSAGKKQIVKLLLDLNRQEAITLVWITHRLDEVVDADRVILLENGRLITQDTPGGIFPQTELLAGTGVEPLQVSKMITRMNSDSCRELIPPHILRRQDLVEFLCRLKFKT